MRWCLSSLRPQNEQVHITLMILTCTCTSVFGCWNNLNHINEDRQTDPFSSPVSRLIHEVFTVLSPGLWPNRSRLQGTIWVKWSMTVWILSIHQRLIQAHQQAAKTLLLSQDNVNSPGQTQTQTVPPPLRLVSPGGRAEWGRALMSADGEEGECFAAWSLSEWVCVCSH